MVGIKNMKMPKDCFSCQFCTEGTYAEYCNFGSTMQNIDHNEGRPTWCPLVEINAVGEQICSKY